MKNVSWDVQFVASYTKKDDFFKWGKDNGHTEEELNDAWAKYGKKEKAAPATPVVEDKPKA